MDEMGGCYLQHMVPKQEQLAEKLGVSNKTVSKWECGKC